MVTHVRGTAKSLVQALRGAARVGAPSLFNTVEHVKRLRLSLKRTPDRSCGDGHHARGAAKSALGSQRALRGAARMVTIAARTLLLLRHA